MHNHTHLVLHIDAQRTKNWNDLEVIKRWHSVHPSHSVSAMYLDPQQRKKLTSIQLATVRKIADIYRQRLCSISFFMKALNQYIALKANREDDCTGKFWESRFKSQALLDERAILSCMIYVDLNPIRAGIATSLENSHYTSIKKRLSALRTGKQPNELKYLKTQFESGSSCIDIKLEYYIQLLQQTASRLKNGSESNSTDQKFKSPLLNQFEISENNWLTLSTSLETEFSYVVGSVSSMQKYKKKLCQKKLKGISTALRLFQ
jgi:hypothetical protein